MSDTRDTRPSTIPSAAEIKTVASGITKSLGANRELTFLLLGRTGVGKSSTINSLLGKVVAPVDRFRASTVDVQGYRHNIRGFEYVVVDTPGLCDDLPDAGNDEAYLRLVRAKVKNVDSLWYVTPLTDTRLTADEKRGIKMVSEALGPEVWERGIIVFTNADRVSRAEYDEAVTQRTAIIKEEIARYAPEYAPDVPAVVVSNTKPKLPNGKEWLGELFAVVFSRFSDAGAVQFLVSMKEDLQPKKRRRKAK